MKDLRWPHAFIVGIVLLVLGGLAYSGKDSAAVVGGILAVLGAMGFMVKQQAEVKEQTVAIKENTNGNIAALMALITQMQQQQADRDREHREQIVQLANKMAEMRPPPPVADPKGEDPFGEQG